MVRGRNLEIIPPSRGEVLTGESSRTWPLAPSREVDGFFPSFSLRLRADRRTRTLEALTKAMVAARDHFDMETQAIESRIKSREAAYRLQELPEFAAHEAAIRHAERAEASREIQHRHELAEVRRATERAQAERALLAADQATAVERERGYEILSKRRASEALDLDLALAERQAILRQHFSEEQRTFESRYAPSSTNGSRSSIDEALYQARAQLHAHGLDTSSLDEILESRGLRR